MKFIRNIFATGRKQDNAYMAEARAYEAAVNAEVLGNR